MATAVDIINAAFRKVGIESPTTAQVADALTSLNNMISMWGAEGLNYYTVRESKALTAGTAEYTVGSGGAWDTVRPMRLLNCYLKDSDGYDWPVEVMSAKAYNDINFKTSESRPTAVYFLPENPLAKIIFNYEPDTTYTAYCDFEKNFTEFSATTTTFALPNEYKEALVYNLAIGIAEDWDRVVSKTLFNMAMYTKGVIESLNTSIKPVPPATFEFGGRHSLDITLG